MDNSDTSFERFAELKCHFEEHNASIVTEEDAKIALINDMLVDVLGWPKQALRAERKHESGFSDYLIGLSNVPDFVLEAKRLNRFEIKFAEKDRLRASKLSGPALVEIQDAIAQVRGYADEIGVPLCVVTDGDSWVVFKTHVSGKNYKEAEAFVFPSIASVEKNFIKFFDLIARSQVEKRIYTQLFDEVHNRRVLLEQPLEAAFPEEKIKITQKSQLGHDLDRVFDVYFGRMTGKDDPDFLINCFVETRESRIADFSLEKITTKVLGNIQADQRDVDKGLSAIVAEAIQVDEGQTVFIVGPTGSGKTTFIERFFRKTLDAALSDKCVDVRVSCLDAGGSSDTIVPWLVDQLILLLEAKLFKGGHPTINDYKGMYFREYIRRAEGVDAALYQSNPTAFQVKFGEFLDDQVEKDREGYLKRLIADVVNSRKKLPILIIDNIDEFTTVQKESVFQLSQALRRHAKHALIIFPITDKSAWALSKRDIFGIYSSKSFFLPTPSPRDVLRKRIDFLREKIDEFPKSDLKSDYFTSKGIRVSIQNLNGFAGVLEQVFVGDEFSAKTLGELTNYNIRRTLLLARRVITSPVFDVDHLVSSVISNAPISSDLNKLVLALLRGDYDFYKRGDRHETFPIFQVDRKFRQSPLLHLRILSFLETTAQNGRDIQERHATVQSLFDYFDALGVTEASLSASLDVLIYEKMIEPFDLADNDVSSDKSFAITHSGRAHINLATNNKVFFEQMALTTDITDQMVARQIAEAYQRKGLPVRERLSEVRSIFSDFLIREDGVFVGGDQANDRFGSQDEILRRIIKFGNSERDIGNGIEQFTEGNLRCKWGIVEQYNPQKGYGFIKFEDISGGVFVHAETLRVSGHDELFSGDRVLCDIGREKKGLAVVRVGDIQVENDKISTLECEVVRLFPDRQYGFMSSEELSGDVFFHYSSLPKELTGALKEGLVVSAELITLDDGANQELRRVIDVSTS
ncbi:cold shock domain-containing protein [Phaeobacter inhibens]|uniref:cold shock domain-containing protein n=1 Tax=Phaeobacter inhibens TaxID=221822 RepID=UPI0021A8E5FB|nr:cold shock domain-containing protein [Phaeobacter inhibens]UWR63276.1 cold shock domain-containing protein [Phaeobacter inhibens]